MDEDQKWCPLCEQVLPLMSFYTTYCKRCNSVRRKRWREANRLRANVQQLSYNRINAEKRKKWTAINRERHHEKRITDAKKYRQAHPDRHANSEGKRRAAKRGNGVSSKAEVKAIYKKSASTVVIECAYCGVATSKGNRHIDHKIPLSRGGSHIAGNLAICCCRCNLRKGTQTAEEFSAGGAS